MSWLTDLAGRAEDFLVKIDKNAAVAAQSVLTKDRITPSHSRRDSGASVASVASDFSANHGQTVAPTSSFKNSISMSDLSQTIPKTNKSKVDLDATLMASLNANIDMLETTNSATNSINAYTNGDLSLQQENNLLKQEIKSLSQEIRQSMQHAKQAQKGILQSIYLIFLL